MLERQFIDAAYNGHSEKVLELLQGGFNINYSLKNGMTALIAAAYQGHIDTVRLLIEKGADINHKNNNCETALIWAFRKGHRDTLRLLLEKGAEIDPSRDGNKMLPWAAGNNFMDIVNLLLNDEYIDINYLDQSSNHGNTALMEAAQNGHIEVIEKLLEQKELQVNLPNSGNQDTALTLAASKGHREIIEKLLAKRAEIDKPNVWGKTALLRATENGHTETVKKLLEHGANINHATSLEGITASMLAARHNHVDILSLLFKNGAAINQKDAEGHNLFYHVPQLEERANILKKTEEFKQYAKDFDDYLKRKPIIHSFFLPSSSQERFSSKEAKLSEVHLPPALVDIIVGYMKP